MKISLIGQIPTFLVKNMHVHIIMTKDLVNSPVKQYQAGEEKIYCIIRGFFSTFPVYYKASRHRNPGDFLHTCVLLWSVVILPCFSMYVEGKPIN